MAIGGIAPLVTWFGNSDYASQQKAKEEDQTTKKPVGTQANRCDQRLPRGSQASIFGAPRIALLAQAIAEQHQSLVDTLMLKNKPRKPTNYRVGPPRGRQYRRNQPYGRYLVRPIDQPELNRFFASRPKARAYARRLADTLGKAVSMLDIEMSQYGRRKLFKPRTKIKC
jgi:hypothetical protein